MKEGSREDQNLVNSQVDEEATEGLGMERARDIFPRRSKGRQLGPSMCPGVLIAFLPGLTGLGPFLQVVPTQEVGTRALR